MRDTYQLAGRLLAFAVAFLIAAPFVEAQSAFEGTWHTDKVQITASMVLLLQDGLFDCKNAPLCDPEIRVKADGTDQPVSGHTTFDTISVLEVSPNSMRWIMKKNGKVVREDDNTLSEDGNTRTGTGVIYRPNDAGQLEIKATMARVGPAPAGADRASGTWQTNVIQTGTDLVIFTFKGNGDGLDFRNSTGASWSAKFDSQDVPNNGVPGNTTISLKRVSDRSFEEVVKQNGAAVFDETWTVSDDGATLTLAAKDTQSGATETYFAHK